MFLQTSTKNLPFPKAYLRGDFSRLKVNGVNWQPLKEARQHERHQRKQSYHMDIRWLSNYRQKRWAWVLTAAQRYNIWEVVLFLVSRHSISENLLFFFAGSLLLFHKIGLWLKLDSKGLRNKRLFSLPAKRLSFGACRVDIGKHCDFILFCSCRLSECCQKPRSQAFCGLQRFWGMNAKSPISPFWVQKVKMNIQVHLQIPGLQSIEP